MHLVPLDVTSGKGGKGDDPQLPLLGEVQESEIKGRREGVGVVQAGQRKGGEESGVRKRRAKTVEKAFKVVQERRNRVGVLGQLKLVDGVSPEEKDDSADGEIGREGGRDSDSIELCATQGDYKGFSGRVDGAGSQVATIRVAEKESSGGFGEGGS